jgi:hypothetical protein
MKQNQITLISATTAHRRHIDFRDALKVEMLGTMLLICAAQLLCNGVNGFKHSSRTPRRGGTTVLQWMRVRYDDMQWVVSKNLDLLRI